MTAQSAAAGIQVHAQTGARQAEILTPEALAFLADLHERFDAPPPRAAREARGAAEAVRRRPAARTS